jgi:Ca2+-binding RTX toxin-like protein
MELTNIQKAYIAFFNRPADASGLAFWQNYPGSDVDLLNTFSATPEYLAEYVNKTPTQIVDAIYQNLFGHEPDLVGRDFWAGHLAAERLTIGNIAITILNSAGPGDKEVIDNKTDAATAFTNYLASHAAAEAAYETGATRVVKIAKDWLSDIGASSISKDSAISGIGNTANNLIDLAVGGGTDPGAGYNEIRATSDSGVTLFGTTGNDKIYGGAGSDTLRGLEGNDWLLGGAGNDELYGDNGGFRGNDILEGGAGNDELEGGYGDDILRGGDGNDELEGDMGNDTLEGGAGHDDLEGGYGDDILRGGDGNDELEGDTGNDTLEGGAGNDTYSIHALSAFPEGRDTITDIGGNDTLDMDDSNRDMYATITLQRVENNLVLTYLPNAPGDGSITITDFYSATAGIRGAGVIERLSGFIESRSIDLWETAKSLTAGAPATKLSALNNLSAQSYVLPALEDAQGADKPIGLVGVADTLTDGGNAVLESFL